MEKIIISGKGGIGKSMIAANLSAVYARRGFKVLHIGCDPKHDSTITLTGGRRIPTVVDLSENHVPSWQELVYRGKFGVDCIEAGGPNPGEGCGGMGIVQMFEILEHHGEIKRGGYDVVIFDVVGDIVCGGFAAPLRKGFGEKMIIIVSEDLMSLYAANNIMKAVLAYESNGATLKGLVVNSRNARSTATAGLLLKRFSRLVNTGILMTMSSDPLISQAEFNKMTVFEAYPGCASARKLSRLATKIAAPSRPLCLKPISDDIFSTLAERGFLKSGLKKEYRDSKAGKQHLLKGEREHWDIPPKDECPFIKKDEWEEKKEGQDDAIKSKLGEIMPQKDDPGRAGEDIFNQWGNQNGWRKFFTGRALEPSDAIRYTGPQAFLSHEDIECYNSGLHEDVPGGVSFLNYTRSLTTDYRPASSTGADDGVRLTTDLGKREAIAGGQQKLREVLDSLSSTASKLDMLIINTTCIPELMGDDVDLVIRDWQASKRIPVFRMGHMRAGPCFDKPFEPFLWAFNKIRKETKRAKKISPAPSKWNLLGFADNPDRREILRLLETAGAAPEVLMLPEYNLPDIRKFFLSKRTIVLDTFQCSKIYSEIFRLLPMQVSKPLAPYGMTNTRNWLDTAARLSGRAAEMDKVWRKAYSAIEEKWHVLSAQAVKFRLAFVIDSENIQRLTLPYRSMGIPILAVLSEMGFGLDFIVFDKGEKITAPLKGARYRIFRFSDRNSLYKILRRDDFNAVYSDFFFDYRLSDCGKAQFSLRTFEMGIDGAIRTIERLITSCRMGFYSDYSQFM